MSYASERMLLMWSRLSGSAVMQYLSLVSWLFI